LAAVLFRVDMRQSTPELQLGRLIELRECVSVTHVTTERSGENIYPWLGSVVVVNGDSGVAWEKNPLPRKGNVKHEAAPNRWKDVAGHFTRSSIKLHGSNL